MRKLLFLILFLPLLAHAQLPALKDTTLISPSTSVTPQWRYSYFGGDMILQSFINGKYYFMPTNKYLSKYYATKTLLKTKIDSLASASAITASNGLTKTGNNITLGGSFDNFSLTSAAGGGNYLIRTNSANSLYGSQVSGADASLQINHYLYTSDFSDGWSSFSSYGDRTSSIGVSRIANGDVASVVFSNPSTPLSTPAILLRDDVQHKGLVGYADYSANYDSLTYVQKGYVDARSPSGSTIASTYVTLATPQNLSAEKTLGSKSHAATFTIYGTSLATKFGFNGTWRYSDGYPYKLTKSLNFQLNLKGGSGQTTLSYTNAIAATPISAYTAGDMIGFEVGVNDATNADATTYSTANFTTRVNSLISSAIAAGYPANRIYIFSAFYWTLGDPTRATDIVNATASIATTRGVLYFDGYNTYKSRVLDNTFTLSGGLHPTIAAHTVIAADMQTYLNAYTINSSAEFLNVYDAASLNTLNSYGSANFTGNTTINNLKLNVSRVAAGDGIGDIYARDADGFTTPIPAVDVGQVFISQGIGVTPKWSNQPTVTRLTSTQDIFLSGARTGTSYSLQVNQSFTPTANNQILSGGLIFPTFSNGTGALTATASGTTSAADGTVTAQATVTTSGTGSGATYTVTTLGNSATVVTMVVAGTGYAIGDTFTIAALPGITFTVASLGYTGVSRSAMTFSGAPITLSTISTPANPIIGQLWNNTTGVLKFFSTATRRVVLMDDGAPAATQMLVGNGTDFTRTTVTGTGAPVLAVSPALTGTPTVPTPATNVNTTQAINGAFTNTYYTPLTRTITTTLPLTGGGDLSANRTLGIGGLTAYGTANQVLGMNAAATGYEYKTITAGTNVSVTQGVNSITIAATGNPIVEITGTTQAAAANTIYIPHNASLTTITMPATTAIGSLYQIIGEGAGGWKLVLPTGTVAVGVGGFTTTAGGSLASTDRYCTITIRLIATNKFSVTTSQGTITPL